MEAVTPEEGRAMVLHRSLGRCEVQVSPVCRPDGPVDWHHRQRRGNGDHRPSNGLAACRACHAHIHLHPEEAWGYGWISTALGRADPVTVPVLLHPRGEPQATWVLLSHGGTYL